MALSNDTKLLASLGLTGAIIGISKVLASGDKVSIRVAISRSILSGALGLCSAFAVVIFPTLSFPAHVGLAAALASLGTSALERLFQRVIGGGDGSK